MKGIQPHLNFVFYINRENETTLILNIQAFRVFTVFFTITYFLSWLTKAVTAKNKYK